MIVIWSWLLPHFRLTKYVCISSIFENAPGQGFSTFLSIWPNWWTNSGSVALLL